MWVRTIHARAGQVFENLRRALAAAGATLADVIKRSIFTTVIAIQVAALSRPVHLLEIEALAVVD